MRVAADHDPSHPGTVNRSRVATHVAAVFLESSPLGAIRLRPGGMTVPFVRLLGHDSQQPGLAVTTNQEWWRRALDRARKCSSAAEPIVAAVDVHRRAGPQRLDDGDSFLQPVESLLERRQDDTKGLMLGFVPAGADAEGQPAAGEPVDGRRHPRQQGRVAKGHRADQRPEANPLRALRQRRQR